MKPNQRTMATLFFVASLLAVNLFISSCGLGQMFGPTPTPTPTLTNTPTPTPTSTLTPTLTPSPTTTPTPAPGIGVEVAGSQYKLIITGVHQESRLSSSSLGGFDKTTYTPKSGYTFLVVDVTIRSVDESAKMEIASNQVAIIGDDKVIRTANGFGQSAFGGGSQINYCVGCMTTITGTFKELKINFVFVIKKEEVQQTYKLQFQDVPPIPFEVK
jgi:hypothetical protein